MRYDDDGVTEVHGVDPIYPLTLFFALGIWFVFKRYQTVRYRAVPFSVPIPEAASPSWTSIVLQNPTLEAHLADPNLVPSPTQSPGRFQQGYPANQKFITCSDPSTGYHLGTIPADSEFDIAEKISRARRAWVESRWAESSFGERKRVMRSILKWVVDNREACARVACRDTGKTMIDAAFGEILTTCAKAEWLINHGESALKPETRRSNTMMFYKKAKVHYEPLGVVSAIVSWNYPFHNCISPIMAALFSGNAIVVKCSEQVIWSTRWYIKVVKACLVACGLPADLVQLVCCYPTEAEALTTSPDIKHITFIGSETVGRKILQASTVHLTPVTLELGGKDSCIILPETDLNQWASTWMRGVFQNCGQNCIGIERFLVHTSQHQDLVNLMSDRAKKLRFGPALQDSGDGYVAPVDCGAMISTDRFANLERIVKDAANDGADVIVGGNAWKHPYVDSGAYFEGTVVGNVQPGMELAQEEVFAPIVTIMPYESIDEAITIANGTRYGLGASVFGPKQRECVEVAKELECGMVSINDFGVFYINQDLPFGGVKKSGFGRFAGPEGLRGLTNPKVIIVDRWPWLIQTSIPSVLDYPVRSMTKSWEFVSGMVAFFYGGSLGERLRGIVSLIKASR